MTQKKSRLEILASWAFHKIEGKIPRTELQESLTKDEVIELATENYPDEITEIVHDWGNYNDY